MGRQDGKGAGLQFVRDHEQVHEAERIRGQQHRRQDPCGPDFGRRPAFIVDCAYATPCATPVTESAGAGADNAAIHAVRIRRDRETCMEVAAVVLFGSVALWLAEELRERSR
jgi:hypothetical protein